MKIVQTEDKIKIKKIQTKDGIWNQKRRKIHLPKPILQVLVVLMFKATGSFYFTPNYAIADH